MLLRQLIENNRFILYSNPALGNFSVIIQHLRKICRITSRDWKEYFYMKNGLIYFNTAFSMFKIYKTLSLKGNK